MKRGEVRKKTKKSRLFPEKERAERIPCAFWHHPMEDPMKKNVYFSVKIAVQPPFRTI